MGVLFEHANWARGFDARSLPIYIAFGLILLAIKSTPMISSLHVVSFKSYCVVVHELRWSVKTAKVAKAANFCNNKSCSIYLQKVEKEKIFLTITKVKLK